MFPELEAAASWSASGLVYAKVEGRASRPSCRAGTPGSPLMTLALLRVALRPGPAFFHALPRAPERQRILRHIVRDATGGRDVGAASNLYRRHQRRVTADKSPIFDDRFVFVHAIVVAGAGTRADVHVFTDFPIAQISEGVRPRTLAQLALLRLDDLPQ